MKDPYNLSGSDGRRFVLFTNNTAKIGGGNMKVLAKKYYKGDDWRCEAVIKNRWYLIIYWVIKGPHNFCKKVN